jgi:hypothetical protein
MDNINILRNNIYNTGYRHQGRWYSSIPAVYAQLNYGEVAGNIIDVSWGNGIDMFWGKGGGSSDYIPFIRGMIHHNKASNTLIGNNDYGGIESWQGGPAYCYNNFSHNASGYKHYNNSSIGYAFYFDGAFKHIVFNNIASGVSHNRNSAGIMQVLGFYNMYVHNTGYNMKTFLNAWKGALGLSGYNTYLSNLSEDIETFFRHELDPAFIPFESYGYNVSSGTDAYRERTVVIRVVANFASFVQVHGRGCRQRSFFPEIERGDLAIRPVVHEESAAPDVAGRRQRDSPGERGRDRSIHSIAALAQNVVADLRSQIMAADDHAVAGRGRRSAGLRPSG